MSTPSHRLTRISDNCAHFNGENKKGKDEHKAAYECTFLPNKKAMQYDGI